MYKSYTYVYDLYMVYVNYIQTIYNVYAKYVQIDFVYTHRIHMYTMCI